QGIPAKSSEAPGLAHQGLVYARTHLVQREPPPFSPRPAWPEETPLPRRENGFGGARLGAARVDHPAAGALQRRPSPSVPRAEVHDPELARSEERRVGKELSSPRSPCG